MAIVLNHGKHQGKTLEWILFHDSGYISYILQKEIDKQLPPQLRLRFYDLVKRASHLKVPGLCRSCGTKPITRMFLVNHISGGLGDVVFCCGQCEPTERPFSEPMIPSFLRGDYFRNYDKTGNKILIKAIKLSYFGNPSVKMSQERMEEFFDNPDNFMPMQESVLRIPNPPLFNGIAVGYF